MYCGGRGVGTCATWEVYSPYRGHADSGCDLRRRGRQGDTIYVHEGTYDENVDVWKRVTLIGHGADVVPYWRRQGYV